MSHPDVADTIRGYLEGNEIEYVEDRPGVFSLTLPGEKKLQTPVRLDVGEHALGVHAFVCRNPDENHARVYRWLLERNLRMYAVAFAVDHTGDIYLDARLPLSAVTDDELDRLLGSVLSHADESFNAILELGFATLDPQGVGVADLPRGVDPQPRGLPGLARGRDRSRSRPLLLPILRARLSRCPR